MFALKWLKSNNDENIEDIDDDQVMNYEDIETNKYSKIISLSKEITSNGNYSIRIGSIKLLLPYISGIWNYQRKLDVNHVNILMESIKKEQYLHGIISIVIMKDKVYIVDGQHIMEALNRLNNLGILSEKISILFEITMCLTNKEILEYYKRVNTSKPLEEYDIIGMNDLDYMERFNELFMKLFENCLRDTEKCLAPYANFKKIKECILENNIHKNILPEDLIECFNNYNEDQKIVIAKRYKLLGDKIKDIKTNGADRAKYKRQAIICEDMKKINCYLRFEQSYEWINEAIAYYG